MTYQNWNKHAAFVALKSAAKVSLDDVWRILPDITAQYGLSESDALGIARKAIDMELFRRSTKDEYEK